MFLYFVIFYFSGYLRFTYVYFVSFFMFFCKFSDKRKDEDYDEETEEDLQDEVWYFDTFFWYFSKDCYSETIEQ